MTQNTQPLVFKNEIATVLVSMGNVHSVMDKYDFDRKITHLIRLRASQINGCAYCMAMHIEEATKDGETAERLSALADWESSNDFTAQEKAALAWTEALTVLDKNADLGGLRATLRDHFSENEISVLTASIAMINMWNRLGVNRH